MSDTFNAGPSYAQAVALLQELVNATNAQAQVINGSLGKPTSGDLVGVLPGPITVVSTHLNAPLPVGQGGSGIAGGNAGGLLYFPSPNTLASSGPLTQFALVLGGGPAAAPVALGSLGTANTLLHGNPIGPPDFGPANTNDVADRAITYAKMQDVAATSLAGNPGTVPASLAEIGLGATLAFVGSNLHTRAFSGDVAANANSFATTVNRILGISAAPAAWIPALQFGGAATGITYSVQTGTAIRLGKLVIAFFAVTLTNKGSATGNATIEGLPVACDTLAGVGMIGAHAAMTTSNVFEIDVPASGTAVALGKGNAVASAPLAETDFSNTTSIAGVAVYISA